KKVPIALVTSSVTADDFAKHQKLNTHADEYIDKRTVGNELLRRIGKLIELGPAIEEDIELNVDEVAEEFSIDEDLAVVDESPADATGAGDYTAGEDATRISGGLVDDGIDAETDAAFAALGMGDPAFDVDESSTEVHRGVDRGALALGG